MKKSMFIWAMAIAPIAGACPLCRDSVDTTDAAGFNNSVGWLLGGLFVVVVMLIRKIAVVARHVERPT